MYQVLFLRAGYQAITDYDEGAATLDLLIDKTGTLEKITDQASTLHDKSLKI